MKKKIIKIVPIFLVTLLLVISSSTFSVLGRNTKVSKNNINNESMGKSTIFADVSLSITWNNPKAEIQEFLVPQSWDPDNNPIKATLKIYAYAAVSADEKITGSWTITLSDSQGHEIGWKSISFSVYYGPGQEDFYHQWQKEEDENWNLKESSTDSVWVDCDATWTKYTWDIDSWDWKFSGMGQVHAHRKSSIVVPKLKNYDFQCIKDREGAASTSLSSMKEKSRVFSTPLIILLEQHPNLFPILRDRLGL